MPNFQNHNNNARGSHGRGGGNRSKNNGSIATEVPTEFASAVSTFCSPSLALPDQWTADSGASA
jgi:hypothetical protein